MALPAYNIDFKKLVGQLLGFLLKKTKRIAWLTAVLKPLRNLHDEFVAFTDLKAYEVKWNGQTIKLEKLLQDKFGGGITITNNSQSLDSMAFGDGVDVGGNWGDGPDFDSFIGADYDPALTNFTVNVPGAIVFVQSEMEAWINKYKMFGTTYNIVIV